MSKNLKEMKSAMKIPRGKNILGKGAEAAANSSTMPLCWSTPGVFRASKEAAGMTQCGAEMGVEAVKPEKGTRSQSL